MGNGGKVHCLAKQTFSVFPVLCPQLKVKGFPLDFGERRELGKHSQNCELCASTADLQPYLFSKVDFEGHVINILTLKWVCSLCASCLDMNTLLSTFVSGIPTDHIVDHFCKVNGWSEVSVGKIQKSLTLAYSLQVLAGYLPGLELHFEGKQVDSAEKI